MSPVSPPGDRRRRKAGLPRLLATPSRTHRDALLPHRSHSRALSRPGRQALARRLPGDFVDDGIVFRTCAISNDLAVEPFGYAPARGVLHRYRVNETFLAQVLVRPSGERSH